MPSIERSSGVSVRLPSGLRAIDLSAPVRAAAGRRRRASPDERDALLAALEEQAMTVVDALAVERRPETARRAGASDAATIAVDVQAGEDAVLLIEQNGVFAWQFPEAPRKAARARGAAAGPRRLTFRVPLPPRSTKKRNASVGGFAEKFVSGALKTWVLKFTARIGVSGAVRFVERNVSEGVIRITAPEPATWRPIDLARWRPPVSRPARVLLFVHGTFSSTRGSFGNLAASDGGRALLTRAIAQYDLVIGFDHRTLSDDPAENAADLLRALESVRWLHTPEIHVVAYSRGGLVFRSLVEQLLPASSLQARFPRAVFVACANGGTRLAEPDNWRVFIDLYTNLVAAAARAAALLPHTAGVPLVVSGLISGLGALVKYVAAYAVEERGVPGLAAMEPDGPFVTAINSIQPGQPLPSAVRYFAVTSDFEPDLGVGALPGRLMAMLRDGLVDQLMGAANDLVVDTAAMTMIDPGGGPFVKGTLEFGTTPNVYHLNYFLQPRVVASLSRWLDLPANARPGAAPSSRLAGSARRRPPSAERVRRVGAGALSKRGRARTRKG